MKHSIELSTSRLILIGADAALLLAERGSRAAFAAAIEALVPSSWPPEHHDKDVIEWVLKSLDLLTPGKPWNMYYIVLRTPRTVIGTCGFKGPPDQNGCVEVGYSVVQEFRGAGLATEAVKNLISTALDQGASEVAAETYPSLTPSLRVMEKCGMTLTGTGVDPGTVRYAIKRQ
jgi:[ribosomal protein S5]-alanine N-acetyltransferase